MSDYFLTELRMAREKYSQEARMHDEKSVDSRDYFRGFATAQRLFVSHIDSIIKNWTDAEPADHVVTCPKCQLNYTLIELEGLCPRCGTRRIIPATKTCQAIARRVLEGKS